MTMLQSKNDNSIRRIFFVVPLIVIGLFFGGRAAKAAISNCECATGSTGTFVWHSTDHTSFAASEEQCSNDCARSTIAPAGNIVYYKYIGGSWKAAQQSCQLLYGGDFACIASGNIRDSSQCRSSCAGGQCCPVNTALNFVGGSNPQQCATGYMCKNILTLPEDRRSLCTTGCNAPDIANGSCCPTSDIAQPPLLNNAPASGANGRIPGSTESGGIVQCGRGGQKMCTVCDIIIGINGLIKYGFRIAIIIALTMITVGGGLYMVGQIDQAKGIFTTTGKGIIFVFAAWLLVNYSMILLGTKSNLGLRINGWGNFECTKGQR